MKPNMVDERFEFAALIFRLVEKDNGYNITEKTIELDYQKEVMEKFGEYKGHETIEFAKSLPLGHDAVFKFAVHIKKIDDKFVFIDDIDSLFDGRWNDRRAEKLLPLFNKFYIDSNYAEFFNSHISYYEELTKKFIEKIYGKVDFKWFGKYIDTSNLHCIISSSIPSSGYGATVNGKNIYCASEYGVYELIIEEYYNDTREIVDVINNGNIDYFFAFIGSGALIVHEYCHSFANPLAEKLYHENQQLKKWCDDSVDLKKNPQYNNGLVIANEYLTRSYTLLYYTLHDFELTICDRKYKYSDYISFEKEIENGFPYIKDVYKMILDL